MQWPLWSRLIYFVDVSLHNYGYWLHFGINTLGMYHFLFLNTIAMVSLKLSDNTRSRNFKTENTLFQKRKNVKLAVIWCDTAHFLEQQNQLFCAYLFYYLFFFLSNYNLKLSHMDVCIILQKKHLTVYKHSYGCFQCYFFSCYSTVAWLR